MQILIQSKHKVHKLHQRYILKKNNNKKQQQQQPESPPCLLNLNRRSVSRSVSDWDNSPEANM